MDIVIDVRLLASGRASGIEEYTRNVAGRILAADDANEYTLFYNAFKEREVDLSFAEGRARVARYRYPNKIFDASIRTIGRPRLDVLTQADLIFSPHFNIVARSPGVKHVMTVHDLSFVHYPEFFPPRKRFWHWLQNYRRQIERADHIIAVSDATRDDILATCNISPEKVSRIYSGISDAFHPIKEKSEEVHAYRRKRGFERPYFLSLAAFEPRKNIPAIIRAFDMLKHEDAYADFDLVLVGASGWLDQEIHQEIASADARSDIRILENVPDDERVLLYNAAFAFVYPSFFEGFGFPPLEAQACDVPVVASNRSSLPEILGDSALLVSPWDIEALADAMRALINDKELYELLVERGRRNRKRFSWDAVARQTIDLFHAV